MRPTDPSAPTGPPLPWARALLGALALLLLATVPGFATENAAEDAVPTVELELSDGIVQVTGRGVDGLRPGDTFELAVDLEIQRGWHIYGTKLDENLGVPTAFAVDSPAPFEAAGELKETEPHERYDATLGGTMLEHEKAARLALPFRVPEGTADGDYVVEATLTVQTCDANQCLMPETVTLPLRVRVGSEVTAPDSDATDDATDDAADADARPALVQERRPDQSPVLVRARGAEGVEPGGTFSIVVEAVIDRGWHIYSLHLPEDLGIPVEMIPTDKGPFTVLGPATEPEPHRREDPTMGGTLLEHSGTVAFEIPFAVPESVAPGLHEVSIRFTSQACQEQCLMPETHDFTLPVYVGMTAAVVENGGAAAGSDEPTGPVAFSASLDRTEVTAGDTMTLTYTGEVLESNRRIPAIEKDLSQKGLWGIIVLSVGGAFIALLTPCVYPMIPITISVFTKQAHQKRSAVLGLALLFCFGVIGSFTGLGLVLSLLLGEQGANFMATNWFVNLFIGGLFIYFAFSLFGYYDIQLPAFLRKGATSGAQGGGAVGVLVMGFVFAVTTFTCVGPIAAALLALAAGQGQGFAVIGMLAFSTTFALPFFFLALFPKALSGLPRSGGWLSTVKGVLGFIEILAAWKFFSATINGWGLDSIISREVIYAIWGITLLAMALYLVGKIRFPHDAPLRKIGAGRITLVFLSVLGAAACFWAVAGKRWNANLESQLLVDSFHTVEGEFDWLVFSEETGLDYEEEIARIRKEIASGTRAEKPIFINFTGHV